MPAISTQTRVRLPPPPVEEDEEEDEEEDDPRELEDQPRWRHGVLARVWAVRWLLCWDFVQILVGVLMIVIIIRFDFFGKPKE